MEGIQYKEAEDLHVQLPILESEMKEETVLASLSKYGRMAARNLQERDQERYEMLLLTGMLLPKMEKVQEQAEMLHERIAEDFVKTWMKEENADPYNTVQMTSIRMQAEMEAERQVIEDIIDQMR